MVQGFTFMRKWANVYSGASWVMLMPEAVVRLAKIKVEKSPALFQSNHHESSV